MNGILIEAAQATSVDAVAELLKPLPAAPGYAIFWDDDNHEAGIVAIESGAEFFERDKIGDAGLSIVTDRESLAAMIHANIKRW